MHLGSYAHEPTPTFFSPAIQPKLNVSQPGDAHEKEADSMAERVMTMPEPAAMPVKETDKEVQPKEEEMPPMPVAEIARRIQCKEDREEEKKIQPKLSDGIFRKEADNNIEEKQPEIPSLPTLLTIDRKAHSPPMPVIIQRQGRAPPTPSHSFESTLHSTKGSGSSLPDTTRQYMESRFGADFGGVRVHTGSTAVQMNRDIHAQAFTHGNDVYFNTGKYAPHTSEGGLLLAHELTHTIQQGASKTLSPSAIATKRQIHRQAANTSPPRISNLDAAVTIAKGETGKVDAGTSGPDGLRTGWQRLIEYFQIAMGTEKVLPEGAPWQSGTVTEGNIKHRGKIDGMKPNQPDPMVRESRDVMPSWCGIFVFWALNKSGLPMPKWTLGRSPVNLAAAYPPGYAPRPGDIAYRNKNSHFAMVEKSEGNDVLTVNGNTAGENNLGGQIQVKKHAIKEWTGFFDPLYGIDPNQISAPAAAAMPKTLRELQQQLFSGVQSVQRKEEAGEESAGAGGEEMTVQAKTQMSHWQVNAAGRLQSAAVQAKEEPTTEQESDAGEKETDAPCATTKVHAIDRMADDAADDTNADRGPPVQRMVGGGQDMVQCSLIDNALTHISEFLTDIPITIDIDEAKRWLLGKARQFAGYIPGYRALGVVLGYDPITGAEIAQNGRNFIEAALDIIPGGGLLKQKLEELGALERAATWIDTQLAALGEIVQNVRNEFNEAWNALGLRSILDGPTAILRNLGSILERAINRIISFAERTATELLDMVKQYLLNQLVTFVREQTTAYPLLRVVLGHDPITEEEVPRNGTNILNAMLELSEDGREQRRQMQDTGTFERIAAWIDTGIGIFRDTYRQIVDGFHNIWNHVSIQSLMDPIGTFRTIYNEFAAPVGRVLSYMEETAIMILRIIKEALMGRLSTWARTVRGYPLVTVILGRDPFTNATVPRSVENIIHGFMSLMEGGEEQFNQLRESGAIQRTVARINAAVARLNMTPAYIIGLFTELWNSFSIRDLANPVAAFRRILDRFGEPIGRLIAFVVEIVKIVIEVILQVMNFPSDLIANIISKAMQAFEMIKRDPVGFLKNLLRAIKQGFTQFFQNILTHLMTGLTGWLMSELRDANVPAPADFSLRGIISWVLQVLGISMENIWEKLAAHPRIGPARVARIRSMINTLEGIWTFIRDVQERGVAAIWERIQQQLTNLWDTVLNAVKSWIMDRIVNAVVTRLLSMLDPTGIMAVINSAIALYRAVQSFMRYLRQMLEIVNSFVEGVVEIASGNTARAANFLEATLARGMPIVIGFLANQVGLSGLGRRIGEMITAARQLVDRAITWLVNRAVDTAFAVIDRLMALGRSAAGAVLGWLGIRKDFNTDNGAHHEMYFTGEGSGRRLIVASNNPEGLEQKVGTRITALEAATGPAAEANRPKITALREALRLKGVMDGIINTHTGTQAAGSANTTDIQPQIDSHLNLIKAQLIIGGVDEADIPLTNVTYEMQNGRAHKVIARPLTRLAGNTTGSDADGNPKGWNIATYINSNRRRAVADIAHGTGASIPWKQVHVLSARLHGPGSADWNLTPSDERANGGMRTVELPTIADINGGAIYDKYEITVTYPSGSNPQPPPPGVSGAWDPNDFPTSITAVVQKRGQAERVIPIASGLPQPSLEEGTQTVDYYARFETVINRYFATTESSARDPWYVFARRLSLNVAIPDATVRTSVTDRLRVYYNANK